MSDGGGLAAFLLAGGALFVALPLTLAMPAALLVQSRRRPWFDRVARAADGRRTACVVAGAGVALASVVICAVLWNAKPLRGIALVWAAAAIATFLVGFSAGAWNQGRRMLGREEGVSCLVLGWLARAGASAVPFLWPAVAAYLVSAACGAPFVALFSRDGGNSTTEPSPGSSPAR